MLKNTTALTIKKYDGEITEFSFGINLMLCCNTTEFPFGIKLML